MSRLRRLLRLLKARKKPIGVVSVATVVTFALVAWIAAPFLTPSLESRSPRVPSVVWSRPQTLDAALPLTRDEILGMLRRRGYVESKDIHLVEGRWRNDGKEVVVRRRAFSTGDREVAADTLSLAFDANGRLAKIRDGRENTVERADLEPEMLGRLYGSYWHDRTPVTLDEVAPELVTAVLEIEDRRFYEHGALDLKRIAGAALANLRAGHTVQGGSTITQQLVKNLWLTQDRTFRRKLKEAYYSIGLERRYSKDEILEAYLNEVYLGQRGPVAIYGMGQGAFHYFGKHPKDLTLSECAFLAGLIQAPGKHSLHRDVEQATARRDLVLRVLLDREKIAIGDYEKAVAEELVARPFPKFDQPAPFVTALVRRSLDGKHDAAELESEGLAVHTTVDARLQRLTGLAVQRHLEDLERRLPRLNRPGKPLQAAVVVLTPHSGEILALVGGRDFEKSQFDRTSQAKRQPGSTFKPVVTLAALTMPGEHITLATQFDDSPIEVPVKGGALWKPVNWDAKFRGVVTLRDAVEQSLNVPMVRLSQRIGPVPIIDTAQRLGIESTLDPVPTLPLGSEEVTLMEITQAYAVFASEGLYSRPTAVHAVRTANGRLTKFHARDASVRFSPAETWLITSALQGAGSKVLAGKGWNGPIAGKTGTTDKARDLWFIGYTPDLVVGVWVGYDDSAPTGLTSASGAAPIASAILSAALGEGYDHDFVAPEGVEKVEINDKGERTAFGCRGKSHGEWFLDGTAPEERCGLIDSIKDLLPGG